MLTDLVDNVFSQLSSEREKYHEKAWILYTYPKSTGSLRNKENSIVIVLDLCLKPISFSIKLDQFLTN